MRKTILLGAALILSACTTEAPRYVYPPPSEAPMAPPMPRPAPPPPYVAPTPQPKTVKPLGIGLLTAKNVGNYMDGEERELRADLKGSGVGVSRPGDEIGLYLRADLLFGRESARLSPRAQQIVAAIAAVLMKYDSTLLAVNGFSDTTGTPEQEAKVSEERAGAVSRALVALGVDPGRVVTRGFGATHLKIPTGSNVSEPRNRRVEIVITPKMAG